MRTFMCCIARISTAVYIGLALALAMMAFAVRWASKRIPYDSTSLINVAEWTAMGLFTMAYVSSWALLLVGPFRPGCEFTLKGGVPLRIVNVLLSIGSLIILHLVVIFAVATARS